MNYTDFIFKHLCDRRALVICSNKNNDVVAIVLGESIKKIKKILKSDEYYFMFLSQLPTFKRYSFVLDVITYRASKAFPVTTTF